MPIAEVAGWMYIERDTQRQLIRDLEDGTIHTSFDCGKGPQDSTAADLVRARERLSNVERTIEIFEALARAGNDL